MEQYIKQYLQAYQVLALGKIGQFTLQYKSSEIHPILHTFTVPGVYVAFVANAQIKTTEDFVDFVAKHKQCSVQDANTEIDKYVQTILDKFHKGESCAIGAMGTFIQNRIGQLDFEASLDCDLSSESFGLESFEWKNTLINKQTEDTTPISQKQAEYLQQDTLPTTSVTSSEKIKEDDECVENEENNDNFNTTSEIENKSVKKKRGCGFKILIAILFILLLFVVLGIVGNLFYPQKIGEWRQQIENKYERYFGQHPTDTSSVLSVDTSSVIPIDEVELIACIEWISLRHDTK